MISFGVVLSGWGGAQPDVNDHLFYCVHHIQLSSVITICHRAMLILS